MVYWRFHLAPRPWPSHIARPSVRKIRKSSRTCLSAGESPSRGMISRKAYPVGAPASRDRIALWRSRSSTPHPGSRLVLPAPLPVQAFEKHLVVLVPRHGLAGVGHPAPGFSTVGVGLVLSFRDRNHHVSQTANASTSSSVGTGGQVEALFSVPSNVCTTSRAASSGLSIWI